MVVAPTVVMLGMESMDEENKKVLSWFSWSDGIRNKS